MARPKSPEKKELIRKAAVRVISEVGFHNCTTDRIAREAGVSVGTIYNYFSDKKDILSYIFKVEHKKLNIYFKHFMKKELPVPDKIRILIHRYYNYIFNNKNVAKLVNDECNKTSAEFTQGIINYLEAVRNNVKNLLEEGIREGTINADYDLDMMVNMIIASANAIGFLGFMEPEKIDYIIKEAPDILYNMLSTGIIQETVQD